MDVLDRTRALNAQLTLPRLKQILRVYRMWVNVEGVEGGMALTRRELQCALGCPERDHHVDFLFATFQCRSTPGNAASTPRMDLMTLLTTATVIAQGALIDKARFVFSLVDLDTEDDIVEAELALVISTCCNGLCRLGLLEKDANLSEMDALTVAYEAFHFVELEEGDKMTFAMFLKWCVFHPRPSVLLNQVSSLLSLCDAVRQVKDALDKQSERLNTETVEYYNEMHFGALDQHAESVGVMVGPIVGQVEKTWANVLIEVDTLATIKCFAFALPQDGAIETTQESVPTLERQVQAFQPTLLTITGLSPGTEYVVRFLGIRRDDRERCVAVFTTKSPVSVEFALLPAPFGWQMQLVNHHSRAPHHWRSRRSPERLVYDEMARDSYQARKSTLTIHHGIFLSPSKVAAMLEMYDNEVLQDRGDTKERILDMIKQEYRRVLTQPSLWGLLRSHSNWILDDNERILFGGFPDWQTRKPKEVSKQIENDLLSLALPVWQSYMNALWSHSQQHCMSCLQLDDNVAFASFGVQFDLESEDGEAAFTRQLSIFLREFPSSSAILLLTAAPIFPHTKAMGSASHASEAMDPIDAANQTSNDSFGTARHWRLIHELIEWNLADLTRQLVFLSFHDAGSYRTTISLKDTALLLTQLVCGPVVGVLPQNGDHSQTHEQKGLRPQTIAEEPLVVCHGVLDRGPHYVRLSSLERLSTSVADRKRGFEKAGDPHAYFQGHLVPLHESRQIHRILGPVVGCVSSRAAQVLVECDGEGEVACVIVDRLTLEKRRIVERAEPYRPVIFAITALTPGRTYDLSFQGMVDHKPAILQTFHEHLPAFRLVIISDDRFMDGTLRTSGSSDDAAAGQNPSYIGNVVDHFLPKTGTLQANVTVHLGCIVALALDLERNYSLIMQNDPKVGDSELRESVRKCVRQHWNASHNQHLLARGAHWFPSIGTLRALLTSEDVPVSFLKIVQRVLAEYEQVDSHRTCTALPCHKYLHRLQDNVAILTIDTLEVILDSEQVSSFVQLPETLLSAAQWTSLKFWLQIDHTQDSSQDVRDSVNTLIIMCDIPLVSQRGDKCEMMQVWHHPAKDTAIGSRVCTYLAGMGAMSWVSYPEEQAQLLRLIFHKLQKNPKFCVVFVCSGAYASQTTITDKVTQLSFQHVVVGPISKSELSSRSEQISHAGPVVVNGEVLTKRYAIRQEIPTGTKAAQQYCALEIVPHPLRASSDTKFYMQHHSDARLILGPIIGQVTPTTARVLVELDRPVSNLSCMLTDHIASKSYSSMANVEAFRPTIFTVSDLQPGTRYTISFAGLMSGEGTVLGHVLTPAWVSLASEWLVVNCNSMTDFLDASSQSLDTQPGSQWPRIVASGMTSFTARPAGEISHRNGDYLGVHDDENHPYFNPWHVIANEFLSEPLSGSQLLIHLGGQVDMSRAFTDEETLSLVDRFAKQVESCSWDKDSNDFQLLRSEVRHRLQEVYRIAWGVPPMRQILGCSSNLMLLSESSDLFFSQSNLRSILDRSGHRNISNVTLAEIAAILRGLALELWQLYQNQLWADVAEYEPEDGSESSDTKAAFSTTFGINRMIIANASHEAFEYGHRIDVEAQKHSSATITRAFSESSDSSKVSLFSSSSWEIVNEALESSDITSAARGASTKSTDPIQHLVFVTSGDLITWAGSKVYPALRLEIVKLIERLFEWKSVDRVCREVAIVCCRTNGTSIAFEVTDEKLNEKLTLTCVGSISAARGLFYQDDTKVRTTAARNAAMAKGHFSRRFSYQSITNTASTSGSVEGHSSLSVAGTAIGSPTKPRYRSFVSYRFISDYRRGYLDETIRYFPPRASLPKVLVGPVIGRMVLREASAAISEDLVAKRDSVKRTISVPILLEINADACIVCAVTDVLANQEVRIMETLKRYHPHMFEIPSLAPERRYTYRFEGIANPNICCGSFHTPSSTPAGLNFLAVSSNFPEQLDNSTDSLWVAIRKRVQVPWCGLDMILHLGGQVPMHEVALECFKWVRKELNLRADVSETDAFVLSLRQKVRLRLQQRYYLCWNVPNVRETLAHVSNWFLRSQADIAPFFQNHDILHTRAAQLVLFEAKKIVADYQLALMQPDSSIAAQEAVVMPLSSANTVNLMSHEKLESYSDFDSKTRDRVGEKEREGPEVRNLSENDVERLGDTADTAQFIQTGQIGVFMCDMRATPRDDVVTCNHRLLSPLTQQECPVIGEVQWQKLEKALKKKALMVFVLCLELPLIVTDAKYVDTLRKDAESSIDEEAVGRWHLYDRQTLKQHWVWCQRQLEQVLNLLFRWKAKHSGRDLLILSGGMRVGLETLLQDEETKLSVRNLTVGPLTARVEPDFDSLPLGGTACSTSCDGASQQDERFTFVHTIVGSKNYLLARAVITRGQTKERSEAGREAITASIETAFVVDNLDVNASDSLGLLKRFPAWWKHYVPSGKIVFWDDTVMMRAQSDDTMMALAAYLQGGSEFMAALGVLFEKHQFAEATRMEELRSKHRTQHGGLEESRRSLRAVFAELWKLLPDTYRQRVAYFQDDFVFNVLLEYLSPDLFQDNSAEDNDMETPPLEFAAFSTLCRDFIFNAGVLNLALLMQQEEHKSEKRKPRKVAEETHRRAKKEKNRQEETMQQKDTSLMVDATFLQPSERHTARQ